MCLYYHQKSDHATQKLVVNGSMFLFFQGEHFGRFQKVSFQGSNTVDGGNPAPVEVGRLSHYLQGFIHPRWLFGISSINSISSSACFPAACLRDFPRGRFSRVEGFPPWMNFLGKKRTWPMVGTQQLLTEPQQDEGHFLKVLADIFRGGTYFLIKILINTVDGSEIPNNHLGMYETL